VVGSGADGKRETSAVVRSARIDGAKIRTTAFFGRNAAAVQQTDEAVGRRGPAAAYRWCWMDSGGRGR